MADYDFRPGGSLKLKGVVGDGGVVKKKKKSKKSDPKSDSSKKRLKDIERGKVKELLFSEDTDPASNGSGRNSPSNSGEGSSSRKTDAEKRFEEVQRQRLAQRVAKLAKKTHKDRVADFNNHLETLSEHHDIPKASPLMSSSHLERLTDTKTRSDLDKKCQRWLNFVLSGVMLLIATHPRDRWESLFVYSFTCKFTNLKGKEGLESPMDLEDALLSNGPHPILTHLLVTFILNLKPHTRNLSADQISTTLASVLSEYFKTSERTVFWDDNLRRNVDPFESLETGIFAADWNLKLKILRLLVELQLTHAPSIKSAIDRAWGVVHNKHKKGQATEPKPDPAEPKSQENLQLLPLGQDSSRKRYWATDESPRVYVSTNPWKITATFHTVSSTREEYVVLIEDLKKNELGPLKKGQKRSKLEQGHMNLIETLESRIVSIDAELARIAKARKKLEQRLMLIAQAELRETRTRKRTQRPDYAYGNDIDSEDEGGDDYKYQEDHDFDDYDSYQGGSRRTRQTASSAATRRSNRTTNKRESSPEVWQNWRGERRSARRGGPQDVPMDDGRAFKRAKTDESAVSATTPEGSTSGANGNGPKNLNLKASGAAALKPTEMAVEQIPGKKKSKFWVYAVEPIPGETTGANDSSMQVDDTTPIVPTKNGATTSESNTAVDESEWTQTNSRAASFDPSMDGSLSPMPVDAS